MTSDLQIETRRVEAPHTNLSRRSRECRGRKIETRRVEPNRRLAVSSPKANPAHGVSGPQDHNTAR